MDQQGKSYFSIFRESLDSPSRPIRVVLFADIVGSTQMKSQGVVTWLPTVGKFYDIVSEFVGKHNGQVVKFLGDGAIAEFSDNEAEAAINAAILIQEALKDARNQTQFICHCSIAITTGRPVTFAGPGGVNDLIGAEVDKAARLCGAAESGAIWVDSATISAANMARVSSVVGFALKREADEYHTNEETIQLKGFGEPIRYREIIWERQTFGVRSAVVSDIVTAGVSTSIPTQTPRRDPERNWMTGRIVRWDAERGHGFIRPDAESRDRFVLRATLVDAALETGDRVAFLPRPAVKEGRNDIAACVVRLGGKYSCAVMALPPRKDYGFVAVRDHNGNQGRLFMPTPVDRQAAISVGADVDVVITNGRSGVIAELIG
jgi:class 3 adenylate cyclase/cold shock CspA family protein